MNNKTILLKKAVSILATSSIVGKKEGMGPLKDDFDLILNDDYFGEKSFEKAEIKILRECINMCKKKANLSDEDIDLALSGDLINQCICSNYALSDFNIPFLGLYGACSTMAEALLIGSLLISSDYYKKIVCSSSSHFCTAEKQFRNPIEYGGQRTPTSQWTVTGGGCVLLSESSSPPYITHITAGRVIDMGICDITNMGACMAPAAFDTVLTHFKTSSFSPSDYDLILTGDLGTLGSSLFIELLEKEGIDISSIHNDTGKMIYDIKKQDAHCGGSGAGCCSSVLCSHIYKKLKKGELNRVLFVATGALMNTMSSQQGLSIPAIAHAVTISNVI